MGNLTMTQFPPKKIIHHATSLDVRTHHHQPNEKDSQVIQEEKEGSILYVVGFFVSVCMYVFTFE